jgi:hypothetical protein
MNQLVRILFTVLLVATMWLRLRYGQGLSHQDDFAYVRAALDANQHGWGSYLANISDIYANRVSIVIPLAAFQGIFGRTELAVEALGLSFSLGTVAITFALGRALASAWAGGIAALLAASIPQEVWYGTCVLPDTVIPFYAGMALWLAWRANAWPLGIRGLGLYVLAGFFVLCAFQARATSGMLLLPLGLWGLMQPRQRLIRAALPGLSFFLLLALFWGALGLFTGDYLIQVRQLVHDGTGTQWTGTGEPLQHLFTMVPPLRLFGELPAVLQGPLGASTLARYVLNTYLGAHFFLVWPAVIVALIGWRKMPEARYPLLAFGALYLFFEFGSTSLTSYQPIWKYERFLTILTVPSSVLVGVVGQRYLPGPWAKPRWRMAFSAAAVLYVALSAALLEANTRHWGRPIDDVKAVVARVRRQDSSAPIYVVDRPWKLWTSVLLRLEPERPRPVRVLSGDGLDATRGATVILDWSRIDAGSSRSGASEETDPRLLDRDARPADWRTDFVHPIRAPRHRGTPIEVLRIMPHR